MHITWPESLLTRALRHENSIIQRRALLHVLQTDGYAGNVTQSFLLNAMIDMCYDASLFPGSLHGITGQLLVSFLRTHYDALLDQEVHQIVKPPDDCLISTPKAKVGFVRSFLEGLANRRPFVGGALVAYLSFLRDLPPLPLFCESTDGCHTLEYLSKVIEVHINFQ